MGGNGGMSTAVIASSPSPVPAKYDLVSSLFALHDLSCRAFFMRGRSSTNKDPKCRTKTLTFRHLPGIQTKFKTLSRSSFGYLQGSL
jgi:hypothetical protein